MNTKGEDVNESPVPTEPLTDVEVAQDLAHRIKNLESTGSLASLRRSLHDDRPTADFYRLLSSSKLRHWRWANDEVKRELQEQRWRLIASAYASLMPFLHRQGSLGRALRLSDYSELRFERLLRASGEELHALLRSAIHQLSSKGHSCGPEDIARLVLHDGTAVARRVRSTIARDFYL